MAYSLGIDIGTSKVATVIIDSNNNSSLACASLKTDADIPGTEGYSEQEVSKIVKAVFSAVNSLNPALRQKVSAIGVTGQMHGVVLWNESEISPLYTWKDRRTAEDGFLNRIKRIPGCENLREGFGNATLAYLADRKRLDKWEHAATIHDYFVCKICGLGKPLTDPSDAASWGLFDIRKKQWDWGAIKKLGILGKILPDVVSAGTEAGRLSSEFAQVMGLPDTIPVYVAIGDNQASILGTSENMEDEIYLTIGTGTQLSIIISEDEIDSIDWPTSVELRPFGANKYLVVAAPLCGGQAFVWLINSIRTWLRELGVNSPSNEELYKIVDTLGMKSTDIGLSIKPNFLGERHNPSLRGEISGIGLDNFSLGNISAALSKGIVENIYAMMPEELLKNKKLVVCSGNAVRHLQILRKTIEDIFQLSIKILTTSEEAAVGAVKFQWTLEEDANKNLCSYKSKKQKKR